MDNMKELWMKFIAIFSKSQVMTKKDLENNKWKFTTIDDCKEFNDDYENFKHCREAQKVLKISSNLRSEPGYINNKFAIKVTEPETGELRYIFIDYKWVHGD